MILSDYQYSLLDAIDIELAETAGDALALAGKYKFDLVLSDIGLPDQTGKIPCSCSSTEQHSSRERAGWELMKTLKAKYNLKGIALSGYGNADDLQRSAEAGFSLHITVRFCYLSPYALLGFAHSCCCRSLFNCPNCGMPLQK